MKKPSVLFYDIETTPNLGLTWGKYDQNVLKFLKRREVLSIAYAHDDGPVKVLARDTKSEKAILRAFYKIMTDADLVVGQNVKRFDHKIVKARMLFHRLPPLHKLCTEDTLRMAKQFQFEGNTLADLCDYLGVPGKLITPGLQLWLDCMYTSFRSTWKGFLKGIVPDASAWANMKAYNAQDVVATRACYKIMKPHVEGHPNMALLSGVDRKMLACPSCGSISLQLRGYSATATTLYRRASCNSCGRKFQVPMSKGGGK